MGFRWIWSSAATLAGLAELAAHFLSLTWGFGVMVVAFLWLAGLMMSASSKMMNAHQRIDAHVIATAPAVSFVANGGSVGGNVTVNGSHTVTGQVNANTLSTSGAATTGGNFTTHGSLNSDGDALVGGSLYGAGFGAISAGNQINGTAVATSGAMSSHGFTSHGNLAADGVVSASNYSGSYQGGQANPGGYPATGSPSNAGLATYSNNIVNTLQNAGLI